MMQMPALNNPWLLTVWPGMGHVARAAGGYLAEQLQMRYVGEFPSEPYFEMQHVDVKAGVASPGQRPRCLLFVHHDPDQRNDLILLLGEGQPQQGGYALCEQLVEQAKRWNVTRVVAFAAMATQMHPGEPARVFGAATNRVLVSELEEQDVEPLDEGQISGLNGLMLAAAEHHGLDAICLLGELPYFAVQAPNPRAARAVLDPFARLLDIDIDFTRLDEQAEQVDQQLAQLFERLQEQTGLEPGELSEPFSPGEPDESHEDKPPTLDPQSEQRVEQLFEQAQRDRSKAFELKRELDRLGVFQQYEDRFLDLFKHGG